VQPIAVTFEPHPGEVLKPGLVVPRLTTTKEKIRLIQSAGISEVHVIPFTQDFAKMTAREFFDQVLVQRFAMAYLAIGHDFHFGRNREGTPGQLIDWCEKLGIPSHLVDAVEADGAPISSSRIRKLVQEGQMIAASRLLGRDFSITGEVVHGDKRGRTIGFPTANILPNVVGVGSICVPARGVYLSSATVEGKTFPSITNVGIKPTVQQSGPLVIETHLLDFDGNLYGKQLTVEFRDRLRDERKFSGLDELKEQIRKDTDLARARLSSR
jgi:riboflavin kinase/FMN adenylyltransferase